MAVQVVNFSALRRHTSRYVTTQRVTKTQVGIRKVVWKNRVSLSPSLPTISSDKAFYSSFEPTKETNKKVRLPPLRAFRPGNKNLKAVSTFDLPEDSNEPEEEKRSKSTLLAAVLLFGLTVAWYAGNIYFNILNKQVLKMFKFPVTCTFVYMLVCGLIGGMGWATGLLVRPKVTKDQLVKFLPMAIFHTLGNALMMVSLGNVPVSFTHTIKACEPFVMVLVSALILGARPSLRLIATLVPVVVGVSMASVTELSFTWLGFGAAMASNFASAFRNVYSKSNLKQARGDLSSVNLLTIVSFMGALMLAPVALFCEGPALAPSVVGQLGLEWTHVIGSIVMAGATMTLYQQLSYNILSKVSTVSHSVMNCLKRIAVIVASVLFFRNPVSFQNAIGTAIALAGVFLYSIVRSWERKTKAAVTE